MRFENLNEYEAEEPNKIFEDILFIRQTLTGDKAAFEKLVNDYRPAIYALVLSYVKNAADAEDLTQEVFIKAYQNLPRLKKTEQFSFWLRQIARNHCKNWLSRRGERPVSFEEIKAAPSTEMASSPEEMVLKQELRGIVWQAIDSLLEIDRKLLKARYLEDVSLKELQTEYGLSYCAIAGRLKRAKQKVRETVQKLLGGFCALPGREVLEKLLLGGIEVMKLSLKAKLVTVVTVAVLGLGGAGVWHWHSKEVPQKPTVVHQQEMKPKKATSASAEKKVLIEKPAPKTAPQVKKAKPPVQAEEEQAEFSDEELAEMEQWLAEMEQSEEQDEAADEAAERTLTPEEQRKVAIFAELATILPRFAELNEESVRLDEEIVSYNAKYMGREFDDQGRRVIDVKDEFDAKLEELAERRRPYLERMNELVPGTVKYGTYNGVTIITGFDMRVIANYLAPKELPYFAAKDAP